MTDASRWVDTRTEAEAKADIAAGNDTELWFACWLAAHGIVVKVTPKTVRPTRADWRQHTDGGDVLLGNRVISVKGNGKWRSAYPHDWRPRAKPYSGAVLIDAQYKFDPTVLAVVIVSAPPLPRPEIGEYTGLIALPHWSFCELTEDDQPDHRKGVGTYRALVAPWDAMMTGRQLVDWLRYAAPRLGASA